MCVQKWSQRTCSHGTVCEGVLANKQITIGMPSLFSGSSSQGLLSVHEDKGNIERRHFDDIDYIRSNMTAALKAIP
jgi:hypothetical protein